ncbi:protein Aster-B-like isoform X2 [Dendronephthya gigantea]|uniref:protein Aster-B-like isoform X2 n=1 Tax=Dendronephthya gigantea TaxID=151771 RepID=UPI00106D4233|nr:protein Aster-B-like isoform X2 [Dendronephthya gigantea]
MSTAAEGKYNDALSENEVLPPMAEKNCIDDDSDTSPPPERPTSLFVGSKYDTISVDESLENESINAEESSLPRSASAVEGNSKFRLRDISPSRLRERRKKHDRKKSDKDSKLSPSQSGRKNIRSSSSWLPASFQQMFPSYKSKTGDFRRLFKDIPESERLITDYSCALQRDILVHGRLYVSQSWLCFYANIFGWETLVTINLKHVTSLTKEKTALVIPNAIQVWSESEKYFFTSFVSRDSTYRSLTRIWRNILSDEPEDIPTLMKAVGKYIDIDSEDVDNSSRGSNDDLPSECDDDIIVVDDDDDSVVDSEEHNSGERNSLTSKTEGDDKSLEDRESLAPTVPDIAVSPASPTEKVTRDRTSKISNGTVPRRKSPETRRRFPFPFKREFSPLMRRKNQRPNKKHGSIEDENGSLHRDSLIEDGSVSESNEDEEVPVLCPCESHLNLECLNEEYAISVDRLYEYLFTDCDFYRSIRSERKHFDLDIEPWVEEDDKKKRAVRYTINLGLTIGPKTSRIQENQQLESSEPGQFYVVETSVANEGVPYADSFVVIHRYCLSRVNPYMSRLRVTALVKYVRPVWGFVKNMITKNSTEALATFFDFLKDFIRTVEDESVLNLKRKFTSSKKRSRLKTHEDEIQGDEMEETGESVAISSENISGRFSSFVNYIRRDNNMFFSAFIVLLVVLILLNGYLSYRVISLEYSTKSWEILSPSINDLPTNMDELRSLLYKQQYIQNIQFKRWQHVLSTSMQFLQQVQDSLSELQKEVEKPLNT